ncbi:MAG TPA: hypothetical protein VIW67_13515 [Terriglobales bacterium]|jgi:hypothetical protein
MRFVKAIVFMMLAVVMMSAAQAKPNAAAAKKAKPAAPASTKVEYYGAVDLGSKGTKATLYSFEPEEDGDYPNAIFTKVVNTKLVSSMADGKFTKEGIADAADAVKQVIDAMKAEAAKQNIDVQVYYVVGSSGVAKGTNKQELVDAVKAASGIDMDFVDAIQEGYYGLSSAVPLSYRPVSMYVDIGSGNTKLGCMVGESDPKNYKGAEIPYGSVSGRNEALKRNPEIVAGVESLMTDINAAYEKQSRDIPCLRNRERIYWTGGAAWATATFTHPEKALSGWVMITSKDLDNFLAQLKAKTWNQKQPVFHFSTEVPTDPKKAAAKKAREAGIRKQALKDRADVQNVFVREDLLSGVSIMRAILNSSNPSAKIRFVRGGNYIYGYALEKFKNNSASLPPCCKTPRDKQACLAMKKQEQEAYAHS